MNNIATASLVACNIQSKFLRLFTYNWELRSYPIASGKHKEVQKTHVTNESTMMTHARNTQIQDNPKFLTETYATYWFRLSREIVATKKLLCCYKKKTVIK